MSVIVSDNPYDAWIKTIQFVYNYGEYQHGIWEVNNLIVVIKNPIKYNKQIYKIYKDYVDKKFIIRAFNKMLGNKKYRGADTYWMRLTNWNNKINQIDEVVKRLLITPGSKHNTCVISYPDDCLEPKSSGIVMNPISDWKKQGFMNKQPCLIAIDYRLRNNFLNLTAFFRSQLAFEISLIDYISLGKYLKYSVDMLNKYKKLSEKINIGKIITHTTSSWIYPKSKKILLKILESLKYSKDIKK